MPKPRQPKRRHDQKPGELREELTSRRLEARLKNQSLRAAIKAQKEMLGTYQAADRGRRSKDWRASPASADAAIIYDAATINPRARQMVRDSWIAKSAVSAFARNVIGCGIIPIPQAKNDDGSPDVETNKKLMVDFWAWASDKNACDVEKDQTFWQQQTLAETERATVGEAFFVWSYEPQMLNGKIDKSQPVGLKLQAFESEQLDTTIISYTDPVTFQANEVRGGIEVDSFGVKVAYHVFSRNPNDYTFRQQLKSQRIEAKFVYHYYKKDRVRQKRGITPLAPVLFDMRDSAKAKDANLWRMIMESCIGLVVNREVGTSGSGFTGMIPRQSGDSGTTSSGMPTVDWVPGMVAVPEPGTTLESFIPQAPGNQYEPFQRQIARGIAAGAGISYGQLTRDFTQGTYSGQRQEMLEDRKEFEPLQEMCAHNLILPIFRLFVAFMALEGRIDAPKYAKNPAQYNGAEYVAPPMTWIDPEKEANAIEKLIQLRLLSREEAAHMRGWRFTDILNKIAGEKKEAAAVDITFPEDQKTPAAPKPPANQQQADENGQQPPNGNGQMAKKVVKTTIPQEVPDYQDVSADSPANCAACRFFYDGKCAAYDFPTDAQHVCGAFETQPVMAGQGNRVTGGPNAGDDFSLDDRGARGLT